MKHLNSNILAAVAVATMGSDALKHEILEIAVLPLAADCTFSREHAIFNLLLKPENPEISEYNINNDFLLQCCERGMDPYEAAELFEKWFEKMELRHGKKVMVLSHDWASKRDFLKQWLQPTAFNKIFDSRYRDPQAVGLYFDDYDDGRNELCRFPKVRLSFMCSVQKVPYADRLPNVIDECLACVGLYKSLIYQPG